MRVILTRGLWVFAWLRTMRDCLGSERIIVRDNARYPADGDWHLWQDDGEAVG